MYILDTAMMRQMNIFDISRKNSIIISTEVVIIVSLIVSYIATRCDVLVDTKLYINKPS